MNNFFFEWMDFEWVNEWTWFWESMKWGYLLLRQAKQPRPRPCSRCKWACVCVRVIVEPVVCYLPPQQSQNHVCTLDLITWNHVHTLFSHLFFLNFFLMGCWVGKEGRANGIFWLHIHYLVAHPPEVRAGWIFIINVNSNSNLFSPMRWAWNSLSENFFLFGYLFLYENAEKNQNTSIHPLHTYIHNIITYGANYRPTP